MLCSHQALMEVIGDGFREIYTTVLTAPAQNSSPLLCSGEGWTQSIPYEL